MNICCGKDFPALDLDTIKKIWQSFTPMTSQPNGGSKGRIAFVGTGLKSIAHMTLESIAEIKAADRVFYHAADGVTASFIRSLNDNCHDLYKYYGTGKRRNITYMQMAESILESVRQGESVCGVFYGHPSVFVKAVRRVMYQARKEGCEAIIYPGITTMDCIFF
jgi:precorrin-3B methylase